MLEDSPFLVHDVCEPGAREVRWLAGIHQSRWESAEVARIADEESLQSRFEAWFEDATRDPPEKLLAMLLNEVGHRATASMLDRARAAWIATVRGRENGILARASRRLQAGEEQTAPAVEAETAPTRRKGPRWKYRMRTGPDAPWTYPASARHAGIAVAEVVVGSAGEGPWAGVEKLAKLWGTTLPVEGTVANADAASRHDSLPGTDRMLYGCAERQRPPAQDGSGHKGRRRSGDRVRVRRAGGCATARGVAVAGGAGEDEGNRMKGQPTLGGSTRRVTLPCAATGVELGQDYRTSRGQPDGCPLALEGEEMLSRPERTGGEGGWQPRVKEDQDEGLQAGEGRRLGHPHGTCGRKSLNHRT